MRCSEFIGSGYFIIYLFVHTKSNVNMQIYFLFLRGCTAQMYYLFYCKTKQKKNSKQIKVFLTVPSTHSVQVGNAVG